MKRIFSAEDSISNVKEESRKFLEQQKTFNAKSELFRKDLSKQNINLEKQVRDLEVFKSELEKQKLLSRFLKDELEKLDQKKIIEKLHSDIENQITIHMSKYTKEQKAKMEKILDEKLEKQSRKQILQQVFPKASSVKDMNFQEHIELKLQESMQKQLAQKRNSTQAENINPYSDKRVTKIKLDIEKQIQEKRKEDQTS